MKFKLSDKRILVPYLIALLATLIMAISVFMPYATVIGEYKEALDNATNAILDSNLGLSVESVKDVSLFEFAHIYNADSQNIFGDGDGVVYVVIVTVIAGFALLGTLFTLFKKGTPIIVFTILSFLVFAFNNFDFSLRGIVPSESYAYGFGYYVFYAATILALAGAILLIIAKHKIKKEANKK